MKERSILFHGSPVIAAIALSACMQTTPEVSDTPSSSELELGTTEQAIINGQVEPSDEFAAVGALVY
ncbi:MAG TPA: hypothetical protein VMG12_15695, partial [Polyangiaceae bacterium]|nr:hypothetical protein [Polyangiaceae bacterium]